MTTTTTKEILLMTMAAAAPPKPELVGRAQVERATALAAKLLAGHDHRADRKPETAAAFGRALASTPPRSEHGKVLAAALRPADWKDRPRGLGTPARVAKPSGPGPGRPQGGSKGPASRYPLPGETAEPRKTHTY
jgi:hypothetical protein